MSELYDIKVSVETAYLEQESYPDENRYVFAYIITMTNEGTEGARLLSRHWVITNSEGKIYEVEGEGVVGEQPYLEPGASYQYTSGTLLDTPVGTMQGSYRFIAANGQLFQAIIHPFTLAVPRELH